MYKLCYDAFIHFMNSWLLLQIVWRPIFAYPKRKSLIFKFNTYAFNMKNSFSLFPYELDQLLAECRLRYVCMPVNWVWLCQSLLNELQNAEWKINAFCQYLARLYEAHNNNSSSQSSITSLFWSAQTHIK